MKGIYGQVGAAPPGPKQNQLPINHKRTKKVAPTVNTLGGRHPAARRALSPHASSRAAYNTMRNAVSPVQDSDFNQINPIDQDATTPGETAADIASVSSIPGALSQY